MYIKNITNYNLVDNPGWDKTHNDYLFKALSNKIIEHIEFDIVIPVGPNDINKIYKMIEYTKKNIIGYRNIYIVSSVIITIENCIFINENIFSFNIEKYLNKTNRNGWYLQQLIKLYAGKIIKNILENYLVLDSDTFFLKPTTFFMGNKPLYNTGTQFHLPYFEHMYKLHPSLQKQNNNSGISHHIIIQNKVINRLFDLVENFHKQPFWEVFLKVINPNEILGSGASEYEIYFNFIHIFEQSNFIIRNLNWTDSRTIPINSEFDYVSCHWYL
jgi:hypothetical protein